jgi:outer membrane protein assembly factor BamB
MSQVRCLAKRTGFAGVAVLVAAGLAAGGCGSSSSPSAVTCSAKHAAAGPASSAPAGTPGPGVAAGWTLPGGNLQNTRDVASAIDSSDVTELGVAWCVPVESTGSARAAGLTVPFTAKGVAESSKAFEASIAKATGEMIAVSQDTGKIEWDDKLPSTPYGAATVTNNVVFTTTYNGDLYAFSAATGAILLKTSLSSGSNAPVTVDGDYVIVGAGVQISKNQLIIAYKLGGKGKLPGTISPTR